MKEELKTRLAALFESYWQWPRRRRLMVGWSGMVLCLALLVGLGYGVYRGGVGVARWVASLSWSVEEEAPTDPTEIHLGKPRRNYSSATKLDRRHFNYTKDFNDINDTQLAAAQRVGIPPIADREAAEAMKGRLVCIQNCQYYKVDPLTHSIPYLVPAAADLLTEIGRRFQDYAGTDARFIITSLLRTQADVKKLKHSNGNASPNSCHRYATTFDITYNRFDRKGSLHEGRLKEDLARALYDLHAAGFCYVKYEYKQACFHVTVRP
jgi:hypothetical protein